MAEPVRQAAREVAPWVERFARLGYVSIGIVYAITGLLTAAAGAGLGGMIADKQDALAFLKRMPLGTFVLMLMALGLTGYAAWRLISAAVDSDDRGADAKGLALRAGGAISGLIYAGIALEVVRLAMGSSGGSGSDASTRHWTSRAMDVPFGRLAVAAAGAVLIGGAVYQLYRAWNARLSRRLRLERLAPPARRRVVNVCRFGIAARAVVFAVIGISLVIASLHADPTDARGTTGAMRLAAGAPYGRAILLTVGIGFVAFGVYALTEARYRTVRAQ